MSIWVQNSHVVYHIDNEIVYNRDAVSFDYEKTGPEKG